MTFMVSAPISSTSGAPEVSGRIATAPDTGLPPIRPEAPGSNETVTWAPVSSNTPALAGAEASGRTMSPAGSVPKGFGPSLSQNRPARVSHPPSALSRVSRSCRHFCTSAR